MEEDDVEAGDVKPGAKVRLPINVTIDKAFVILTCEFLISLFSFWRIVRGTKCPKTKKPYVQSWSSSSRNTTRRSLKSSARSCEKPTRYVFRGRAFRSNCALLLGLRCVFFFLLSLGPVKESEKKNLCLKLISFTILQIE